MSVLIKGMKMPKSCWDCRMVDVEFSFCHGVDSYDTGNHNTDKERPEWCPLVEIPPHGRLIDADELLRSNKSAFFDIDGYPEFSYEAVIDAPTIIPAEEGET